MDCTLATQGVSYTYDIQSVEQDTIEKNSPLVKGEINSRHACNFIASVSDEDRKNCS